MEGKFIAHGVSDTYKECVTKARCILLRLGCVVNGTTYSSLSAQSYLFLSAHVISGAVALIHSAPLGHSYKSLRTPKSISVCARELELEEDGVSAAALAARGVSCSDCSGCGRSSRRGEIYSDR